MRSRFLIPAGTLAIILGLATIAVVTRQHWLPWLIPGEPAANAEASPVTRSEITKVQISPQAEAGLGIVTRPIQLREYWRSLEIPGSVVDRPGESNRAIPAPASGYISAITARPGDTVRPGSPLFTMRVTGEYVLQAQSELHKTAKEIQLNAQMKELLNRPERAAVIPQSRLIELEQQEYRLNAVASGNRQILLSSGFGPEQIADAEKGIFATEIRVSVPVPSAMATGTKSDEPLLEVHELKLKVGEPAQAGQTVFVLTDHQALYVEGRAFKQEAKALARAAKENWPVRAEFVEESRGDWPEVGPLTIRHLANAVDSASRTFAFFLSLPNQSDFYTKDGRTFRTWRFQPGQRVRLRVPVERWEGVFVVPSDAVVRDGAEAYVFRRNGDFFERRPVAILHEDSAEVVVKDDGILSPRQQVAMSGAAALNRALKALQASGQASNVHVHADGTVHAH